MTNSNGMQQITASDGHSFDCHITRTTATRRGGLVILQEIFGVTEQLKSVAAVRSGGKVAVIGFCWGGGLALRAAQNLNIAGAVAFYGTRLDSLLETPLKTAMQFHFGATDDHSPPEVIAAVQAAYPQAECHIYDTGHAFANDARPTVYNKAAADTAHGRTREFLARVTA